jgi:hypothetical protein
MQGGQDSPLLEKGRLWFGLLVPPALLAFIFLLVWWDREHSVLSRAPCKEARGRDRMFFADSRLNGYSSALVIFINEISRHPILLLQNCTAHQGGSLRSGHCNGSIEQSSRG